MASFRRNFWPRAVGIQERSISSNERSQRIKTLYAWRVFLRRYAQDRVDELWRDRAAIYCEGASSVLTISLTNRGYRYTLILCEILKCSMVYSENYVKSD